MAYTQTTFEALKTFLLARVDGAAFWTDEEAANAWNEVLRDWNLFTGRWRTRVQVALTPQSVRVTLPGALVYGMRVRDASTTLPLDPTSLPELDVMRTTWRLETIDLGGAIPARPWFWAPESLTSIVVWPTIPLGQTRSIDVDGIAATPVLVEDADWVDLGDDDLDPLADFALHLLLFKEGGPRWRATRGYWVEFLRAAAEKNAAFKASQAYRRVMGLDRRRDLLKQQLSPTRLDGIAADLEAQP